MTLSKAHTSAKAADLTELNGSVKELNISIYFFIRPLLNGVLFLMFCLLVEWECRILVFKTLLIKYKLFG